MEEAFQLNWAKLPAPVLSLVRQSCSDLVASTSHVTLDSAAVSAFAAELVASPPPSRPRQAYPLNFPTPRSEVNFLATLATLQVGSGWRRALHAQRGGRGAAETITFGCLGFHISGEITADAMVALGLFETAQLFGLKIQEDYEISMGIHSERPTELYTLAETLRRILNDTGVMLKNLACNDWYDFFIAMTPKVSEIDEATGQPKPPSAELMLTKMVRHFKWLQDAYILKPTAAASEDGAASSSSAGADAAASPRVVYVLKKAQLILGELYLRFHDDAELGSVFGFGDVANLTLFSDNVLPAVLRAKGVLVYSPELAAIVDATPPKQLKNREMEAAIRAAAIVAGERIVQEHNAATPATPLTALILDYYLWLAGKKEEYRKIERHATHSGFY